VPIDLVASSMQLKFIYPCVLRHFVCVAALRIQQAWRKYSQRWRSRDKKMGVFP